VYVLENKSNTPGYLKNMAVFHTLQSFITLCQER
jgi:hypothetical protein